ncbi:PREDICTED: immunoglobulin-binding protein 1 [Gekko japonicus]|uniref:immunoglobulin-binding protein 1 n=1 Tax=Gekko japonicus TaxID=146911 RepID=UPI00074FF093|nr:PREDICTED: immunoglobulin-binding protein 1 [Gekko japonicus]
MASEDCEEGLSRPATGACLCLVAGWLGWVRHWVVWLGVVVGSSLLFSQQNRYKQKKELENRLASLKTSVDSGQADEEQIREYYLLQITKWVSVSLEEIESIDQETAILSRRGALKQGTATQSSHAPRPPMKPFILTRDAAQAKVFGAGYPSLATMSVNDWYEQHRKRGFLPDQGISQAATAGTEERQKDPEEGPAKEEEEPVWKAREWDDWKDTHPRGYGNRKNMG